MKNIVNKEQEHVFTQQLFDSSRKNEEASFWLL